MSDSVSMVREAQKLADEEQYGAAYALLEQAHLQGDAEAAYALATWYLHGRYVQKNVARGVGLLTKAMERGSALAAFDLAVCYETGVGRAKDILRARDLYIRASGEGDVEAMYAAARLSEDLLADGRGSATEVLGQYERAAAAGSAEAAYALGYSYEMGSSVTQRDMQKALVWYRRAKHLGHVDAVDAVAQLTAEHSQDST